MGIVNVTPDSFSDGGRFLATQAAIDHATRLVAEEPTSSISAARARAPTAKACLPLSNRAVSCQ